MYRLFIAILRKISTLFFLVLSLTSIISTAYVSMNLFIEIPILESERIGLFFQVISVLALVMCIAKLEAILFHLVSDSIFSLINSLALVFICMIAILAIGQPFGVDQYEIADIAVRLNRGVTSDFTSLSYLRLYPFQIGMVNYERILFALFGEYNFFSMQVMHSTLIGICLGYFGSKICSTLADNNNVKVYYFSILFLFLPLYVYSLYLYSDIPSIALCFLSIYFFIKSKHSVPDTLKFSVFLGLSLALRLTGSITLVAMIIIICFSEYDCKLKIQQIVIMLVVIFVIQKVNILPYMQFRDVFNHGSPFWSHIAMGLQGDCGWYNGFNRDTYFSALGNKTIASDIAMRRIHESLTFYFNYPMDAVKFFAKKFFYQWNEPTVQAIAMNWIDINQNAISWSYRYGIIRRVFRHMMNGYQTLLFILNYFFFRKISHSSTCQNINWYLLILNILGGFLFSLMWESKTRYILPYYLMMIPYASVSAQKISNNLIEIVCGKKTLTVNSFKS